MSQYIPCDFFLFRYVPDVVRGEFVNIGVLLRERPATEKKGRARVRFTRDWSRVTRLDPAADVNLLKALAEEVTSRISSPGQEGADAGATFLQLVRDTFSGALQISEPRTTFVEDGDLALEQLMRLHVEDSLLR